VVRRLLTLTIVLALLSGCEMFKLHQFDPMTAAQIERTIAFEEADYAMTDKALEDLGAPDVVRDSLELRHDSEIARLRAWLLAELAKRVDE
jgi:hypothetical protein